MYGWQRVCRSVQVQQHQWQQQYQQLHHQHHQQKQQQQDTPYVKIDAYRVSGNSTSISISSICTTMNTPRALSLSLSRSLIRHHNIIIAYTSRTWEKKIYITYVRRKAASHQPILWTQRTHSFFYNTISVFFFFFLFLYIKRSTAVQRVSLAHLYTTFSLSSSLSASITRPDYYWTRSVPIPSFVFLFPLL